MAKKRERQTQKKAAKTTKTISIPKAPSPAHEDMMAKPAGASSAPGEATAAAPPQPRTPDPRLPAPGTVLQKRDRHGTVRCECTIEEAGVCYAGNLYRSLSAAAMAAAKDLGLANKTQNGFVFWGLSKPRGRSGDPVAALAKAWERYHERAALLVGKGVTDENRDAVRTAIRKHAGMLGELAGALS